MKPSFTFFFLVLVLGFNAQNTVSGEFPKTDRAFQFQKGNFMVTAFPSASGAFGNVNASFGFSLGHSFKFGYFVSDRLCLNIGSIHSFQYNRYVLSEISNIVSKNTLSSLSLSLRYYLPVKRVTPFLDMGFESFFGYGNGSPYEHVDYGYYHAGSAYAGFGISIPVSRFNISCSGKYLYPVYASSRFANREPSFACGWQPEIGISFIFNQGKKKFSETNRRE